VSMLAMVFKILLMFSGALSWIVVGLMIWIERRSRRFLTGYTEEWPEPIFRKLVSQPSGIEVLRATLRRESVRLGEAVEACRQGAGGIAIEDLAIRDEINDVFVPLGLQVVAKE
jgi:hypothetical protein